MVESFLAMTTKTLIDKIEALPPEKKAEVEDFLEFLARRGGVPASTDSGTVKAFSDDLLERIRRRRERLFLEHGDLDTLSPARPSRQRTALVALRPRVAALESCRPRGI